MEMLPRRRAKIIATLGPASASEEVIHGLIDAGVNVFRLNFAHGSPDGHRERCQQVRRIAAEMGRPVAILQDLAGPKLRVGPLPDGSRLLRQGEEVLLTGRADAKRPDLIPINYPDIARIPPGSRVLLDDGRLELRTLSAEGTELRCRVTNGGLLAERKGVNFPDVPLDLPAITPQDRANLITGLEMEVDYVAISFIRRAKDVREARQLIAQQGKEVPLIAKIEKPQALEDLPAILEESDGVMVARGDLGVELAPERVPILQKEIIEQANEKGRLVIVATQMLESMLHEPRPTRAEASDIANAVIDGADALMLSGETAVGEYPLEAVRTMARVIEEAERSGRRGDIGGRQTEWRPAPTHAHAISHAAREIAHDMALKAIIAFTRTGFTARLIAKDRPAVPILAATPHEAVWRRLSLLWGVTPILCPFVEDTDGMIASIERELLGRGYLQPGDPVLIMGGMPVTSRGPTNFLKIHIVESSR